LGSPLRSLRQFFATSAVKIFACREATELKAIISVMYRIPAQLLAVFLVATTWVASPATLALNLGMPPAGCHKHSRSSPQPASNSYLCCQVGHSPALQQAVFRQQALVANTVPTNQRHLTLSGQTRFVPAETISSSSSPPSPLRI
jgi:hypothetical protein